MFARMFERSSLVRRNCQKVDEVCFICDQPLIQCTGFLLRDEGAGNPFFWSIFMDVCTVHKCDCHCPSLSSRLWSFAPKRSFHGCDGNSSHLIAAREPFYPKYDDVMYKNHTNGIKYCQDLCILDYLLIVFVCKIRFSFPFSVVFHLL